MGIHIYLHIQPQRIDELAWARVYDDLLYFLRAYPDGLIGLRRRGMSDGVFYSRDLEVDADDPGRRHLTVCGDMKSKKTGEGFELYQSLYPAGIRRTRSHAKPDDDILLSYREHQWRARQVFGSKTQGCPYHLAILAIAMLMENRFPSAAVVSGDIDAAQAARAAQWVHAALGKELRLPATCSSYCLAASSLPSQLSRNPHPPVGAG